MYKVLAEIVEEKGEKTRGESNVAVGGRVRSEAAKKAVAKAIAKGVNDLDSMGLVDLKTGAIKSKRKTKSKEKSPEEMALKETKTYVNKFLALQTNIVCCSTHVHSATCYPNYKEPGEPDIMSHMFTSKVEESHQ